MVEATLNLQPEGTELLAQVLASDLFSQDELPKPSKAECQPPRNVVMDEDQPRLLEEYVSRSHLSQECSIRL